MATVTAGGNGFAPRFARRLVVRELFRRRGVTRGAESRDRGVVAEPDRVSIEAKAMAAVTA